MTISGTVTDNKGDITDYAKLPTNTYEPFPGVQPMLLMSSQQSLNAKHRESQKQEIEKLERGNTSQLSPTQHPLNPALTQEPAVKVNVVPLYFIMGHGLIKGTLSKTKVNLLSYLFTWPKLSLKAS